MEQVEIDQPDEDEKSTEPRAHRVSTRQTYTQQNSHEAPEDGEESAGRRRFAACMIIDALQCLGPLFDSNRTDAQYFEAVESLVWLVSPGSDMYFEVLGWEADKVREKLDLPLYAELAHTVFDGHREFMVRMYVATARYTLQERRKRKGATDKIPYPTLVRFAEDALSYTTFVLDECRASASNRNLGTISDSRLRSILSGLGELLRENGE